MCLFGAAHGCGGTKNVPLPKICHTYHAVMKLGTVMHYLKKVQKYLSHVTHPLSCGDTSFFHRKSENFAASENTDIGLFWYIISDLYNFFLSLKRFFNKHGYNVDDVSNWLLQGFLNKDISK